MKEKNLPLSPKQKPSSQNYERFSQALEEQKQQHLYRELVHSEKKVLFSSNDYLGLSQHPKVVSAAIEALKQWGFGSGSARTLSTHLPVYLALEKALAHTLQKEKALLFSSGYQLNSTLLKTLAKDDTLFFLDKYCHRSLIEGAQNSPGKVFRFKHNDPNHLEELLKKHRHEGKEAWIVTESLFSMQGTRGSLEAIAKLKREYETFLIVDEAHTIGIERSTSDADLVVGGFGKALGGFGGFVAGAELLIDYILNFSPGFLFTTALPPAIVVALHEAIQLLPHLDNQRNALKNNTLLIRNLLNLPDGDHIVPYPVKSAEEALFLSKRLRELGFEVPAIRPPTVPPNGSLLRFSMTALHTESEIEKVSRALKESMS